MPQLKRIKYVSEFADHLTRDVIETLAEEAAGNNALHDITGILVAYGRLFFQVIEGPGDAIDELYANITKDKRHRNVLLLNSEWGVKRIFPDWAMKRIDMDDDSIAELEPLRAILEMIVQNRLQIDRLTGVLERSIWERFSEFL